MHSLVASENPEGIAHYHSVLAALGSAGIDVALTMWHWDTPQALENAAFADASCVFGQARKGSAWTCPWIGDVFSTYAQLLVREYGPQVKYWITLNEPLTLVSGGYASTNQAPARPLLGTQPLLGTV